MTDNNPLEVENAERRGQLKGLSGDELYDRLHPSPDKARGTAQDVLEGLRKRAKNREGGSSSTARGGDAA